MDEAHLSNPAGRLWLLLTDFQARASKSTQQNPIKIQAALAEYLGISQNDRVGYYRSVAAILNMPVEIRASVEALETPVPPKEVLLRPLTLLEGVLPHLAQGQQGSKGVADAITSGAMSELEVCSYVLSSHAPKKSLAKDTLNTIRDLANDIIDTLADDDTLSVQFREAIRVHAQRISAAVAAYKLYGSDAMLDELDSLTGVIVRNYRETTANRAHPVFEKVKMLTAAIVTATAVITAPAQISSAVDFYEELTAGDPGTFVHAPGDESATQQSA